MADNPQDDEVEALFRDAEDASRKRGEALPSNLKHRLTQFKLAADQLWNDVESKYGGDQRAWPAPVRAQVMLDSKALRGMFIRPDEREIFNDQSEFWEPEYTAPYGEKYGSDYAKISGREVDRTLNKWLQTQVPPPAPPHPTGDLRKFWGADAPARVTPPPPKQTKPALIGPAFPVTKPKTLREMAQIKLDKLRSQEPVGLPEEGGSRTK